MTPGSLSPETNRSKGKVPWKLRSLLVPYTDYQVYLVPSVTLDFPLYSVRTTFFTLPCRTSCESLLLMTPKYDPGNCVYTFRP